MGSSNLFEMSLAEIQFQVGLSCGTNKWMRRFPTGSSLLCRKMNSKMSLKCFSLVKLNNLSSTSINIACPSQVHGKSTPLKMNHLACTSLPALKSTWVSTNRFTTARPTACLTGWATWEACMMLWFSSAACLLHQSHPSTCSPRSWRSCSDKSLSTDLLLTKQNTLRRSARFFKKYFQDQTEQDSKLLLSNVTKDRGRKAQITLADN